MTTTLIPTRGMTRPQTLGVTIAALATLLVSIVDETIVTTTAVPITAALQPANGAASVPWLLAAYALASTVVQPLYGKLADAIGVKGVYLAAVGVFVLGSVLCGFATDMPELIGFRALQGLGGGGLMSVTMVVIGHLRSEDEERGTGGNAIAAALVGLGLVAGPLLGGVIVNGLGWRWVFLVNVPLGLAALATMAVCLRLPAPATRESLELPSAGLLAVAAASLLSVCQWGGHEFAWGSWQILGSAAAGMLALVLFVWRQARAVQPFFPPRLLRQPTLRVVTLLQLATGCGMAAGIVYLTLDLQLVHGSSPIATGLQLIPVAVGLGLGAWAGQRIVRTGRPLRASIAAGAAASALALGGFALCSPAVPMVVLYGLMLVFGTGIGLGLGNEMLLVFSIVDRADLGVATTGIRFVETLGTSLGATAFATLFAALVPEGAGVDRTAGAIDAVFWIGAALVGVSALVALRIPRRATATPSR